MPPGSAIGGATTTLSTRRSTRGGGAQTFEEIGRRYKADGDFRTTVDRYVQEFERLLSQIQHDDPDDRMLRGYLGSDSGKVYTMLAHASGRLA